MTANANEATILVLISALKISQRRKGFVKKNGA
jgi:hypothetical protein